MFLKVESARQGAIKGEAQDENHKDEIDVIDWSWGMQAKTALSGGGESPKATLNELQIVKQVDSASTGLMSAMRNNDLIKKAVLTVRKAGGAPHEYFKISIEKGRITSLDSGYRQLYIDWATCRTAQSGIPEDQRGVCASGSGWIARGSMLFDAEIS